MKILLAQFTHMIGILTFIIAINPYFIIFSAAGYLVYLILLVPRWHALKKGLRLGLLLYPSLPSLCWIGLMLTD